MATPRTPLEAPCFAGSRRRARERRGWARGWVVPAVGLAALSAAASVAACASSELPAEGEGGSGGGSLFEDAGNVDASPDAACALYEEQGITKPVNLYIMFDKSSSMAGDKWLSAEAGLRAFVDDDASAGLKVALRFFPRPPDAIPACDQFAYKEPTVPFGLLPGNAQAIKDAIGAEQPDGFSTPVYPALGGAILMGIEVAENNPDESSAVLLVTDGSPQGPAATCGGFDPEDPQVIADLAATGAAYDPPVVTYVVGLPGVDQSFANLVAAHGGSDAAILVGATNVEEEFRQALLRVRGDAVPCEYLLPDQVQDGEVAISHVNVEVTPGMAGGDPRLLPQDAACSGDGWRYDDPAQPTAIVLCPATCDALKQDLGASIRIVLGCSTITR